MKNYELKALLATLDDSAEVSIELENPYVYRISGNIKALIPCGAAPRTARLQVTASDLGVIPNAQERIEELEQQLDYCKSVVRDFLPYIAGNVLTDKLAKEAGEALEALL